MIALDDIRIDGGTQTRTSINEQMVNEYADAMRAGAAFPPLTVIFDGASYWLADGFHRYHALRATECAFDVDCRNGNRRDAVLFSVGANSSHGLRRTNDDKRKAVKTLLEDAEWVLWSDRKIAEACAVSHPFVAGLRAVTGNVSSEKIDQPRNVVTKHGTQTAMNTAGISTANKGRAKFADTDRPALALAPQSEDHSPSAGELEAAEGQAEDEQERVRLLLDADAPLAAMTAKCAAQAAQIRILNSRITGLLAEKNAAIKAAKSWQKKAEAKA